MKALKSIINTFDIEEQQKFILFLKQKNKRKEIKNILLFQLIAKGEENPTSLCKQLYNVNSCNAFNALKKRLLQSLVDFTANKNIKEESSLDIQIIKYILASRSFLLKKNYVIAFKILDKAESLAQEHLLYPLLNEIYHTKIQYANYNKKQDLENLILKQKENQKKHQLEDQLNIIYAKLKQILDTIKTENQIIDFEILLKKLLQEHHIQLNESLTFKSLYQILAITNLSAFVNSTYFKIEKFVLNGYELLKKKKETDKQLYYQIHIVYIISNTLFRNKKFNQSLGYIKEMEELMLLKKEKYYNSFVQKKNLVKALNLNFIKKHKEAIQLIEETITKKNNDIETTLDLHLTLLMFYFQQENFVKAKSVAAKFYHTDKWYINKSSLDWVMKKNLAELLIYIELKEEYLFYSRLKSFKRSYTKYIKETKQERILTFLKLAELYYTKSEEFTSENFKKLVKSSFELTAPKEEDIFVLSYFAWLKSKINNESLYETTLKLLNF